MRFIIELSNSCWWVTPRLTECHLVFEVSFRVQWLFLMGMAIFFLRRLGVFVLGRFLLASILGIEVALSPSVLVVRMKAALLIIFWATNVTFWRSLLLVSLGILVRVGLLNRWLLWIFLGSFLLGFIVSLSLTWNRLFLSHESSDSRDRSLCHVSGLDLFERGDPLRWKAVQVGTAKCFVFQLWFSTRQPINDVVGRVEKSLPLEAKDASWLLARLETFELPIGCSLSVFS